MSFFGGFDRIREERKNLSFFKIFSSADLSSETMRAFPYTFISKLPQEDFSNKMSIRAKWGRSWEVKVSKNQRFYYMEKLGWNKFVRDNGLGENEFITLTHKGKMRFNVNIYGQDGKEIITPPKLQNFNSSGQVKKEPGESSNKNEEIGESPGGVRKRRHEESSTTSKKKSKSKSKTNSVPEFTMTIRKSYLKCLTVPTHFEKHMPKTAEIFKIHHSNGKNSWKVHCLKKNRSVFSSGYSQMARECPLVVNDICTFKLIKPREFLLVISKKEKVE